MLSRRLHGFDLRGMTCFTSSECFVLEMVVDNLNHNPQITKQVIGELMKRRGSKKKDDRVADIEDGLKNEYDNKQSKHRKENLQLNNVSLVTCNKTGDKKHYGYQTSDSIISISENGVNTIQPTNTHL